MPIRVNVNGRLGRGDERMLSPMDSGFLYGASAYESLRTYGGRPFRLAKHLARLRESAQALAIPVDVSDAEWVERVDATLEAAGNEESSIRLLVSNGPDLSAGSSASPEAKPQPQTVVVIVKPLVPPAGEAYTEGVRVALVDVMRNHPASLSPEIKSSNLLNNQLAMRQARERGAFEAIMLNHRGEICEAASSNVFLVKGGIVITPPLSAGILSGLTREMTLEVAREQGLDVRERTVVPDELATADEMFLTASSKEILPVRQIDDDIIGTGSPGPVTLRLLAAYRRRVVELMAAEP